MGAQGAARMLERGRAMHKAWSADSVQLQPASRHVPTRAVEQLPSRKTSAFAEPWFSYPTITGTRILLGVCVLWGIWTLCMLMARPDHQRVYGHAPSAASGDSVGLQEGAREQRNLFQEQQQHWRQRYKTRSKGIQVHPRAPTGLSPGSSSQPWEMISQPQVEASKDDSQVKVAKPMPLQQNWLKMSLNQPLTRIIGKAESPKPKELAKSKGVPATVESTSGLSGREKTKPDKTTGPPGTPAATAPLNTTEYVEKVIPTLPKRPVTCIAWRQTSGCDPNGPREPDNDRACNSKIEHGASGYCEFLDRRASPDGEVKRAMLMHCNSHPQTFITKGVLTCGQISEFVNFAPESLTFRSKDGPAVQTQLAQLPETRGIVFCVADGLMISTYAVVRILRQLGCTLPFELWYLPDELTQSSKAIVGELVYRYGAQMRPIPVDRTKLCHGGGKDKCFSVKIYAVYHSKFHQVLLMDTDNFPLRDPTYLFDAPQFKEKGAIFWPDYWSPGNTIFNVWNTSLVWELTGLDFVNMFEQESGQVLIDRKRHFAALDILAFYSRPDNIMYRYGPVYGDKDLFRLAWMRAGHSFHMIEHPPGWAGRLKSPYGFCGLTMVQYGPEGDVLFLHRNGYKVDSSDKSKRPVWDAIVQWVGYEGKGYWAHTWVARKRWGFPVSPCYGPQHEDPGYERTAGKLLDAVKELEKHILTFASEANLL